MPGFRALRLWLQLAAVSLSLTAAPASLTLYTEHFPPYSFLQQQQVRGINADLIRLACQRAAIQCEFVLYPWLRAVELAQKNPHSGIFSIVRTPKRAPLFQWLGPLASSKAYLYRLKRRPDIRLQQLSDAKAYSIGVAHGDIYEEFFLSQGFVHGKNLVKFSTKSEPVPLFLKGKIDLLIASELMLSNWLPATHSAADVEAVFDISAVGQNFLALHPAVPAVTAQSLQQALTELAAEGQLQQLVHSYQQQAIPGP